MSQFPADKPNLTKPANTDFITQATQKTPHLREPLAHLTRKINDSIDAVNLKSIFCRTLLLKDTTVKDDVADHVPVVIAGNFMTVHCVLRKPITKDLTVVINIRSVSYTGQLFKFNIPKTQKVSDVMTKTQELQTNIGEVGVLSFDIKSSDGQVDAGGIASISMEWVRQAR